MTYGSETRPLLVDVGLKFERAEMQMIRWMCGISLKDRMTNEELRRLVGVEPITTFMRGGRLSHRPPIQLHTPIYLKQHTGPLDVSRESGASAGQVEETAGRASLEKLGCRTPPQLHAGGVGRQQQQGRRPVGRPRKTWLESVETDVAELEIDKEDVHDRRNWRRNIVKRKSNPIGKRSINR